MTLATTVKFSTFHPVSYWIFLSNKSILLLLLFLGISVCLFVCLFVLPWDLFCGPNQPVTHYIFQSGLRLRTILLPQLPEDYRHMLVPSFQSFFIQSDCWSFVIYVANKELSWSAACLLILLRGLFKKSGLTHQIFLLQLLLLSHLRNRSKNNIPYKSVSITKCLGNYLQGERLTLALSVGGIYLPMAISRPASHRSWACGEAEHYIHSGSMRQMKPFGLISSSKSKKHQEKTRVPPSPSKGTFIPFESTSSTHRNRLFTFPGFADSTKVWG